jgi:hypothetical protein
LACKRRYDTRRGFSEVPSFQSVYREYFDFVWSTVRRLGIEPESMDDVVQDFSS